MATITHSYGIAVGGFIVGGGYGKHKKVSAAADRCAAWLARHIDAAQLEVRCNSDGLSGGAFCNGPGWITYYGLAVGLHDGRLEYDAFFTFPLAEVGRLNAEVPYNELSESGFLAPQGFGKIYSPKFKRLSQAGRWLTRYGRRFCPEIRAAETRHG